MNFIHPHVCFYNELETEKELFRYNLIYNSNVIIPTYNSLLDPVNQRDIEVEFIT